VPQIFKKEANLLVYKLLAAKVIGIGVVGLAVWYYFSPRFVDVGYHPKQPLPYSHRLHAGDLGIDCRYCHTHVDQSAHAGVPSTQTCMNCHSMIFKDSPNLAALRDSWAYEKPMKWVKVHDLPKFAHFNHSVHVKAGVGCQSCHGDVAAMDVVYKSQPLSMRWCLDCHRNPAPHLRPAHEITNTKYNPPDRLKVGEALLAQKKLNPPEDCSSCHH